MRIIEKILDRYYTKKVIEDIDKRFKNFYFIDIEYQKGKYGCSIRIKKQEYKDYFDITYIPYNRGIHFLLHIKEFEDELAKSIEEYLKELK